MQKPEYVPLHILQLRYCRSGGNRTVCWHKQQLALAKYTWVTSCSRSILHNPCQLPSEFCRPQQATTDLSSKESSSSLRSWCAYNPVQHLVTGITIILTVGTMGRLQHNDSLHLLLDCAAFASHAIHLTLPVMTVSYPASLTTPHHMLRVKHPNNLACFAPSKHQPGTSLSQ